MIVLTPRAVGQVRALRRHYEKLGQPEATRNLVVAIASAWQRIATDPAAGLAAPRPYPNVARPCRAWVQAGRDWIAYTTRPSPAIVAVVYDAADLPGRLQRAGCGDEIAAHSSCPSPSQEISALDKPRRFAKNSGA